jgi:hypothetical protein
MKGGAKNWYFPDGFLPEEKGSGPLEAHEALMILNVGTNDAHVLIDLFFEGTAAIKGIKTTVQSERVKTLRLDNPKHMGGFEIPALTQYAIAVRSDVEVIVQFGRLDTTQTNLAYYGTMGFYE